MSTGYDLCPTAKGSDRYRHQRQIGVGGFGVVDACFDRRTGEHVAVKTILSAKVHAEAKRLVRELDIMNRLKAVHPNLMTITDAFVTPTAAPAAESSGQQQQQQQPPASSHQVIDPDAFDVHLVMPLMRGDLHRFSREFSRLPVPDPIEFYSRVAVVFAFQTAYGLDYLHRSGIVHRDLKPDNVLVNVDVTDVFQSSAVIADFGLARAATPTDTFYICTRQYRPPEVITNTAKGDATIDMWSLGCVFWELVTGKTLFHLPSSLENGHWVGVKASYQLEELLNIVGTPSQSDIATMDTSNVKSYLQKTKARDSQLPALFQKYFRLKCTDDERALWFDLISSCLAYYPQKRPTAGQVCQHRLFQKYQIFFGENVQQFALIEYKGGATSEIRRENKAKIRSLVDVIAAQADALLTQQEEEQRGGDDAAPAARAKRQTSDSGEGMAHSSETATTEFSPPVVTQQNPTTSPAANLGRTTQHVSHTAFPRLRNPQLAEQFRVLPVTAPQDVQLAINQTMAMLQSTDPSAPNNDADDLRLLLNFFVALLPVPATEEDDMVPTGLMQQQSPVEDDDA